MKFGQLIEYIMKIFSSKIMQKMRHVDLVSIYYGSPLLGDTIQTNCIKLQT